MKRLQNFVTQEIVDKEMNLKDLTLFEAIQELNRYNGWSISDLSFETRISRNSLYNIRDAKANGNENYKPSKRTYETLAYIFNIDVKTLMDLKLK